jgi:hypothetical protein
MGGIGSGNHGGCPAVEDGLVLDLNRLIRQRIFRPGAWAGSIIWSEVYSGRETARIGYECFMGQESGHVRPMLTERFSPAFDFPAYEKVGRGVLKLCRLGSTDRCRAFTRNVAKLRTFWDAPSSRDGCRQEPAWMHCRPTHSRDADRDSLLIVGSSRGNPSVGVQGPI